MKTNISIESKVIVPFDYDINKQLRSLYIDSLKQLVSYDGGKTTRPRVRHHELWKKIPPFGQHGWDDSNIFKSTLIPADVTQGKTWVWSDLHFGHKNIIRFSNRPFSDVFQMDEMLVKNFNDCVQPEDRSIWVGDVAFGDIIRTNQLLDACNGYKILIVGNHDFGKRDLRQMNFNEIHVVYNLTIYDRIVAFTHYPMDNLPNSWYNVHGHVHVSSPPVKTKQHINVNCEFIEYKPIDLMQLAEWIRIRELQNDNGEHTFDYTEYD